jgi:hypothetical protein
MPWEISDRWTRLKEVADANVGTWVLFTTDGHNAWPRHIITGRLRAFEPFKYDAIMRDGNGHRGSIYIRRIPEEELHAQQDHQQA